MKRTALILLMLLPILLVSLLFAQFVDWANAPADYETRDIAQYGIYVGNSEEYMQDYIGRFFPTQIEDYFDDVTYVFKSRAIDTYGFEALLEFTIEDEEQFQSFAAEATEGLYTRSFHYDPAFQEYLVYEEDDGYIHDGLMLGEAECREKHGKRKGDWDCYADPHPGQYYRIDSARIAKILVDHDAHRMIYVALAVHDGGGSSTDFFCEYFNRFGLDPKEYEAYTDEIARFDKTLVTKVAFVTVASDGTLTELEALAPERYSSFFEDYANCKIYINWKEPVGGVTDSAILLTFQDGSYYLFDHDCTIRTINGKAIDTREYYDEAQFVDLWNRYCSQEYS